jgi:hypothetical protein
MKNTALLTVSLIVAGNLTAASPMNPMQGFYQRAKEAYGEWRAHCVQQQHDEKLNRLYWDLTYAMHNKDEQKALQLLSDAQRSFQSPSQHQNHIYWSNVHFSPLQIFSLVNTAASVNPEFAKKLLAHNDNALAAELMHNHGATERLIYERANLAPQASTLLAEELAARDFLFSSAIAKKAREGEEVEHDVIIGKPFKSHYKVNDAVAKIITTNAGTVDFEDGDFGDIALVNPLIARKRGSRVVE